LLLLGSLSDLELGLFELSFLALIAGNDRLYVAESFAVNKLPYVVARATWIPTFEIKYLRKKASFFNQRID